ncbi:hypothetical protein Agub_g1982, partial [Astrephomene gubernaculifera]
RVSYNAVRQVFDSLAAELRSVRQQGSGDGVVAGTCANVTPGGLELGVPEQRDERCDMGSSAGVREKDEEAANAAGVASRGGPEVPAATIQAGIAASVACVPLELRPQLLELAMSRVRPRLEATHGSLMARREAYVARIKQYAQAHRQPEPDQQQLEQLAPCDPLPPPPEASPP